MASRDSRSIPAWEFATLVAPPLPDRGVESEAAPLVNRAGGGSGGDSAWSSARKLRWTSMGLIGGLLLLITALIFNHPLATNDGPVHLAFSHLIATWQLPDHTLQGRAYSIELRLNPNLAVYLLMAALMRVFSPGIAESIIQILCIVGPVSAGFFAFRMIQPKNAWLAIFLLPLSLNQMFFLGLYNHCLSTAAFFLAIGTYHWLTKSPSTPRAAALSGALVLTFFCHASGFIMATTGIIVITATVALLNYRRYRQMVPALRDQRFAHAAIVASLPLAAIFLLSGGHGVIAFGLAVLKRLRQFAELHVLSVNYPLSDRFAGAAVSLLLIASFAFVSTRILKNKLKMPNWRRDQAIGTMVASVVVFAVMLAFPDFMGGGWTHFRRFEIFPYFWLLLTLSFDSFTIAAAGWFMAVGTSAALFLMGSVAIRQSSIRNQMTPLSDVNRLIGSHCTVLPIVLEPRPEEPNTAPAWVDYEPFFQSASRLELTGDRVVLFNYLARLTPYPIHFRSGVEPQEHVFHWQPIQPETGIERVDLNGFEHSSGMAVDYILLWGNLDRATPEMQKQIEYAIGQFDVAYTSPDRRVTLYRRRNGPSSPCEANPAGSGMASIY